MTYDVVLLSLLLTTYCTLYNRLDIHSHTRPLWLRSANGLGPVRRHSEKKSHAVNLRPVMSNGKTIIEYWVQMAGQRRLWTSADRWSVSWPVKYSSDSRPPWL